MSFDGGGSDGPIGVGLQRAVWRDGARIEVVGEHDPMTYEDAVLERDALADETVTGNLAVFADDGVALNLNEGADARARADAASVEVDQVRLVDDDTLGQDDGRRNHAAPALLLPAPLPWMAPSAT